MARPRTIDPATLGPRQVAGYFCRFGSPREYTDRGVRYTETLTRAVFDDELAAYGRDHPWPLQWDHGMDALTGKDPDQLTTVPIGRSLTVDPDAYGPFTVVELRAGRLADEVLAAARAREVGFSFHASDVDSDVTEERDGRLYVVRRKMALREITLTGRPAEPGACVVAVGGPAPLARAGSLTDLRDVTDEDLIARAGALIEATGGSLALLKLRAAQERTAQRRRTIERAALIRELAQGIVEGRRRAAALRTAAAIEAGRWPQDPHRPAAVIVAEALIEGAAARQAEEQLAEECCHNEALITAILREARTA